MVHPSRDDRLRTRSMNLPGERARPDERQRNTFRRRRFGRKKHTLLSNQPAKIYEIMVGLRLRRRMLAAFDIDRKTIELRIPGEIGRHDFAREFRVNNKVAYPARSLTRLPLDHLPANTPKLLRVAAGVA